MFLGKPLEHLWLGGVNFTLRLGSITWRCPDAFTELQQGGRDLRELNPHVS